jgi:hypothetical protein
MEMHDERSKMMTIQLSRRAMLKLIAFGTLGSALGACTQQPAASTQPVSTQQPNAEPVPTQAAAPTVAATTITEPVVAAQPTEPPAAVPLVTAEVAPNVLMDTIAASVSQFLGILDENQRTKASYAFEDSERMRWHWTTPQGFPRNGLPLNAMQPNQRDAAFALLQASVSAAGYQKALDIISLQRDLGNDPDAYYVTVFGTSGSSAPWGWRWEGHHLSRNFTLVGDQIAVTPLFLGAWPTTSDAGLRALPREEDAARELVTSLPENLRAQAIFQQNTLTRHVTQNDPEVRPLEPVGIAYADVPAAQQQLIEEIIQSYLHAMPDQASQVSRARIDAAGLAQIRFGWAGALEPRKPHYYRIQGPTFLLEYDNSRNSGTHIHSVWREFTTDFGRDLL